MALLFGGRFLEFWIAGAFAAFFLGMSKGGLPVIAILSVPIMALFMDPAMAAGLLLPLYLIADCYAIYLFRHAFSAENLKIMLPGAVLGAIAGFASVAYVPGEAAKLLLAIIGLSYLAKAMYDRFLKRDVPATKPHRVKGLIWGALAGFTSYIAHAGGPPFQVYILPQRLDKMIFLGTTAIFFAVTNLTKLPLYVLAGQLSLESTKQTIWLAPAALFGAWTAANLSRILPQHIFFYLVELALFLISIRLLYEVFSHLD